MNEHKHTGTDGCAKLVFFDELIPLELLKVGSSTAILNLLHFFKYSSNISFAATPRIFRSSIVGGAERVSGARCGE
jgi:hypothetical protein